MALLSGAEIDRCAAFFATIFRRTFASALTARIRFSCRVAETATVESPDPHVLPIQPFTTTAQAGLAVGVDIRLARPGGVEGVDRRCGNRLPGMTNFWMPVRWS